MASHRKFERRFGAPFPRKLKTLVIYLLVILPYLFLIWHFNKFIHGTFWNGKDNSNVPPHITKHLLIWSVRDLTQPMLPRDFKSYGCPEFRCTLSQNKKTLDRADIIAIHVADANRPTFSLPSRRISTQKWVFFTAESQQRTEQYHIKNMTAMNGIFNATMTVKEGSDILFPYGHLQPKTLDALEDGTILPNVARKKSRLAVWVASSCYTHSRREVIVRELLKHIPVDIYGDCGPYKCRRNQWHKCLRLHERHYKFYIAFENSLCKDYLTEKLWKALEYNMVPVVFGGPNYKALPADAFINAEDFESVEQLAGHLKVLDKHHWRYNRYFEWKKRYIVVVHEWRNRVPAWCNLCVYAHSARATYPQTLHHLDRWWNASRDCSSLTDVVPYMTDTSRKLRVSRQTEPWYNFN